VVDNQHQPTPAGGTGAGRVRTSGVDGYLAYAATTRAFCRDGFFYPGDLGMLREDGRMQILGRVTDVINVMGDKIATTPIEWSLQAVLGAKALCVFSAPGESGVKEVHVVIEPGEPVSQEALKAALHTVLPRVRAVRFHAAPSFARNQMGEIDRPVLRARLAPGPGQG
jgi:acyl-coenzyme A synthetase/AMP-(fatty) acid ligase